MLVLIESPYAPRLCGWKSWLPWRRLFWHLEVWRNLAYVRAAMRDCLIRYGEEPFASHALYTQPGVLCDELPGERRLGINSGLAWGRMAQKTVVYTDRGISLGMLYGIDAAEAAGRPIEYRQL